MHNKGEAEAHLISSCNEYAVLDRRLWHLLVSIMEGEAAPFVKTVNRSGFVALEQLSPHFDPSTGADRTVAYGRVTMPVTIYGQAKTGVQPLRDKISQARR